MSVQIKRKLGTNEVTITAESLKDAFRQLAAVSEILVDSTCGCCKSENIRHSVRNSKDSSGQPIEYYELRCADCNAQLTFGQNRDQRGLFAKRGEHPETRGWYIYQSRAGADGDDPRDYNQDPSGW